MNRHQNFTCGACRKQLSYIGNDRAVIRRIAHQRHVCVTCKAGGRKLAKRVHPRRVMEFFGQVFGVVELQRFRIWIYGSPRILFIQDDDDEYDKVDEISVFDRLLSGYEPLAVLCHQVDPITRRYPLQKVVELGFAWEEVRRAWGPSHQKCSFFRLCLLTPRSCFLN